MKIRRMAAMLIAGVLTVTSLPMNSLYVYADTPANGDSEVVSEETTETEEVTGSEDESLTENESETETLSETETETEDETESETETESEDLEGESKESAEPMVIKGEITKTETVTSEALMNGAAVASGDCGVSATWSLDSEGTLTISGRGAISDYTGSNNPWKDHKNAIKKVVISEGITVIGDDCFYNYYVEEVLIPSTVVSIGTSAFSGCKLREIVIPANVQKIGASAFYNNSSLSKVRIESRKLTSKNDNIFMGCNISEVDFATDLSPITDIPAFLFDDAGFVAGTTVTIPRTVKTIGESAFKGNKNINLVFEAGSVLTTIGNYAFSECQIEEVTIPSTVTTIGSAAFKENDLIREIVIPRNVQTIGTSAFFNCSLLSKVRFETRKLTSKNDNIFYGCNISEIDFATDLSPITDIPAYLFEDAGFAAGTTITIPRTVKTVSEYAFKGNKNINLAFEAGTVLTTIGNYAFSECQIEDVTIPSTVTSIGTCAFNGNNLIREIVIPQSVQTIGTSAFFNCTLLSKVRFETRKLTSQNDNIFYGCNISEIDFATDLSPITDIPAYLFEDAGFAAGTTVTIPRTVKNIGEYAFKGNKNINLVFEAGSVLTTLGNCAFFECQIENVSLPSTVTSIGTAVFQGNNLIREIIIPQNVQKLGDNAFCNCSMLSTIKIESGKITGPCYNVFYNCPVDTLVLGKNMKSIPYGLLKGIAFYQNCEVVIPSNITRIENCNFYDGTNMGDITIPASVNFIGDYVFSQKPVHTRFHVTEGSYAYKWAKSKGYTIVTAANIQYVLNGGTNDVSNKTVGETDETITLHDPTRKGYTFGGWYDNASFNGSAYTDYTVTATSGAKTFYAKWTANPYDVTLDLNGENTALPSGQAATISLDFDSTYKALPTPTRTGYTFKNWTSSATGGTVITANKTKLTTEGATIYAQWTPNTYTVRMHSNLPKDTVKNQGMTYDATTTLAANTFKQTGYVFTGWNTAKDGSGTAYTDKQSVSNLVETNKGTFDLYGQWKKVDYFIFFDGATLSTDANPATSGSLTIGGSDLVETDLDQLGITNPDTGHNRGFFQAVQYGESIELTGEEFVRRGYTLTGWKNSKTGKVIAKNATLTNLTAGVETVTLTAQWSLDTYTVKYNLNGGKFNGGSGLTRYNVETAEYTLPTSAILVRPGYTFTGWYDNNALTGSPIEKIAGNNDLRSLNLYAGWAPVTYNIARDANIIGDDTDTKNSSVVKYDEKYTLNKAEFTRPGYTLSSWNTQRDGKGKKYSVSAVLKNVAAEGETYTVYAQWSPNTYKVTYNLNGGKQTGAPTTYKPSAATTLKIPVKTGYTFTGWTLTMKDGTANTASVGNDATPATVAEIINEGGYGNIVLTAGWKENTYKVRYHINRSVGLANGATPDDVVTYTYDYTEIINLTYASKSLEAPLAAGVEESISGFTTKPKGGTKYVLTQKLTKLSAVDNDILDFYANWGPRTYYITYDYISAGEDLTGVTFRNEPYTYSSATGVGIPNPSKKGYVFTEWTPDKTSVKLNKSKTGAWSIAKESTGDTKLTATFEPVEYSVTVYPNGSGVKFADDTAFTKYERVLDKYYYSVTGSLPVEMVTLTRAGFDFVGYNTKANGTGIAIDGNNIKDLTTSNNANVNIYAIWKAHGHEVQYEYALRENGVDGAIDESDIVNNNKTEHLYASVLKLSNPTKTGYTFNGWLLTSDDNSVTKSRTGYVTQINAANDADVSLKAIFTENKYTLSINSNGGVNDTTRKAETLKIGTIAYTDEVDLDDYWTRYTRKGYEFKGFATDKNGKNMLGSTVEGLSAKNGAAVVVYAIWTKVSPVKPSNVVVTSNEAGKINVAFTAGAAIAGIDGTSDLSYEIQYSKGLIFRNAPTITTHYTTETISNSAEHPVTSGKRYQVRIRECRTDSQGNTVYSAWSMMKGVTVR